LFAVTQILLKLLVLVYSNAMCRWITLIVLNISQ